VFQILLVHLDDQQGLGIGKIWGMFREGFLFLTYLKVFNLSQHLHLWMTLRLHNLHP
jgi:hypothetical protein